MILCKVCEYREGLDNLTTVLGSSPVCLDCFEARAENRITIHEACRQLKDCPHRVDIFRGVTCWAGLEYGYMSLRDYEHHISHQLPAIAQRVEEDRHDKAEALYLLELMDHAAKTKLRPGARQRRRGFSSWWHTCVNSLTSYFKSGFAY